MTLFSATLWAGVVLVAVLSYRCALALRELLNDWTRDDHD